MEFVIGPGLKRILVLKTLCSLEVDLLLGSFIKLSAKKRQYPDLN